MSVTPIKKVATAKTRQDKKAMEEIHTRLDEHDKRISNLETIADSLNDIGETVDKIFRYIKVAGPSIISAAVAAGIVNGKLGEFFKALLN